MTAPGKEGILSPPRPNARIGLIVLSMMTMLTLLLLGEVLCRVWEFIDPVAERQTPIPGPVAEANRANLEDFKRQLADMRAELGPEHPALLQQVPMVEDESRGWTVAPSQVIEQGDVLCRINSLGMRGPELGAKGEEELRLMTLGDSTVFGTGVAEDSVFGSVTAKALSQSTGRRVQLANGAAPGHDSSQSLATLRLHGATVAPDWVVIANLWSDVYRHPQSEALAEQIRGPLNHLATYRLLKRALAPWLTARKVRWIASQEDIGAASDGSQSRIPLRNYLGNLEALAEEATALGATPVFLVLPAPMDFDGAPLPPVVQEYRAAMAQVAATQGGLLVSGPAAFREADAGMAWFMDQVHPTAAGHAILASSLVDVLENHLP